MWGAERQWLHPTCCPRPHGTQHGATPPTRFTGWSRMGTDAAGSRAGRVGGGEEAGGRPREGFEGRGLRGTPDSWLHPEAGATQHCRMPAARSWLGPGGPRREQGAPRVRTQTEGRPLEMGVRLRVHAAEPCSLLPPLPRPLAQTGSPTPGPEEGPSGRWDARGCLLPVCEPKNSQDDGHGRRLRH